MPATFGEGVQARVEQPSGVPHAEVLAHQRIRALELEPHGHPRVGGQQRRKKARPAATGTDHEEPHRGGGVPPIERSPPTALEPANHPNRQRPARRPDLATVRTFVAGRPGRVAAPGWLGSGLRHGCRPAVGPSWSCIVATSVSSVGPSRPSGIDLVKAAPARKLRAVGTLRVLVLNNFAPPVGGAEEHVARLIELLGQAGHDARLLVPDPSAGPAAATQRLYNRAFAGDSVEN